MLNAQPHRPIALFAPRRVGKTFFLENDLSPAAHAEGFITVYADLWLHKTAPLDAINHALEEALDELTVPTTTVGKIAKAPVRKVGGLGASLESAMSPNRASYRLNRNFAWIRSSGDWQPPRADAYC